MTCMPRYFLSILFAVALGSPAFAQAPAPAAPATAADDEVTRAASALESELTKYKNTTPEAAEVMVKLIDLYHKHGRLFGLVRTGQSFVNAHPQDPRHKDAMLKLIDGLEAMS